MRILLLTTHLDFGGIGIYCISLAKALKDIGHDVRVASAGGALVAQLDENSIQHIKLKLRTKSEFSPMLWKSRINLGSVFKEWRPDIVHAQTRVTQVLAWMVFKKYKIAYVSTCHGFFRPHIGRRLFGFWGRRVIAISDAVREHLVNDFKVKKENIRLINNGIDIDKFQRHISEKEKKAYKLRIGIKKGPVIGVIARLSPVKGHKYLFLAASILVKKYPDLQLLIIGDGPSKRDLIELAISLGIGKSTFIEESTLNTNVALSVMDVFVLPSVQEGLGLSALEAMAAGIPVVASNVGGVYSLIKDSVTGLLVEPKDSQGISSAVSRVLDDKKLTLKLVENARAMVSEKFLLSLMANNVEALYKEVVDDKTQKP